MTAITYVDHQGTARTVAGEDGSTVMETAVKNGIPGIEAECGGACACATCHVYVAEAWLSRLPAAQQQEVDMLDFGVAVQDNSRLACQIRLSGDTDGLTVTLAPESL